MCDHIGFRRAKSIPLKESAHEGTMVGATGEHAKTRWYPRVASGSVRLCHREVCTVTAWVCESVQRESSPLIGIWVA